jgi:metal-responsive CopG/Arc/MetJ family transcriptional regulator
MGRKPIGERAAPRTILRLPDEIGVRVDAYAKTLGIKTRSEAVRSLLLLGLATHYEAERKRTAPKRKGKS